MCTLPTTPLDSVMRDSGLTPEPIALDGRIKQFAARLASAYDRSNQIEIYNHPTSGATIWGVIKAGHK